MVLDDPEPDVGFPLVAVVVWSPDVTTGPPPRGVKVVVDVGVVVDVEVVVSVLSVGVVVVLEVFDGRVRWVPLLMYSSSLAVAASSVVSSAVVLSVGV